MCTRLILVSLVDYNRHTNIGITCSKEITTTAITTTTATTTNNEVNANSGPGPVIQIVSQLHKYECKLRRQGWYMQTQASDW